MYLMSLNIHLELVKMVNFMLCMFYHNKKALIIKIKINKLDFKIKTSTVKKMKRQGMVWGKYLQIHI